VKKRRGLITLFARSSRRGLNLTSPQGRAARLHQRRLQARSHAFPPSPRARLRRAGATTPAIPRRTTQVKTMLGSHRRLSQQRPASPRRDNAVQGPGRLKVKTEAGAASQTAAPPFFLAGDHENLVAQNGTFSAWGVL